MSTYKLFLRVAQNSILALTLSLCPGTAAALEPVEFSPTTIIDGGTADALFGLRNVYAGDVNGDGFDDVLVSAPNHSELLDSQGRASLFLGSAAGLEATPAWTIFGSQQNETLGSALTALGDVNNDGFDDFGIASFGFDAPSGGTGRVQIFHGGADGPSTTPTTEISAFDTERRLGTSISGGVDLNNDGFDDLVVGAPSIFNDDFGKAYVFYGSQEGINPTPAATFDAEATDGFGIVGPVPTRNGFGNKVVALGSVDASGDNFIAITASEYTPDLFGIIGYVPNGRVYLYQGGDAGISSTPTYIIDGMSERLGLDAFAPGDINNDGFDDLVLIPQTFPGFFGPVPDNHVPYFGSMSGPQRGDLIVGTQSGPAGDLNNDGFTDFVIGDPQFCVPSPFVSFPPPPPEACPPLNTGRVFFYLGEADTLAASANEFVQGLNEERFGSSVASNGDVDGDGASDVVIGIAEYDGALNNQGQLQVYHGIPDQDGDEIIDGEDKCQGFNDAIDHDVDGTPNGCDLCPNDSAKSEPLVCGCGELETDSDGDGTEDCIDECPSDETKTAAGACGCGQADLDENNNGIPDCLPIPEFELVKAEAVTLAQEFGTRTRLRGLRELRKAIIEMRRRLRILESGAAPHRGAFRRARAGLRRVRFLYNKGTLTKSRRQAIAARITEQLNQINPTDSTQGGSN